jgi:hypothetical protein
MPGLRPERPESAETATSNPNPSDLPPPKGGNEAANDLISAAC